MTMLNITVAMTKELPKYVCHCAILFIDNGKKTNTCLLTFLYKKHPKVKFLYNDQKNKNFYLKTPNMLEWLWIWLRG